MPVYYYYEPEESPIYEANTWNTGDIITADLLNHLEEGNSFLNQMFVNSWEKLYEGILTPSDFEIGTNIAFINDVAFNINSEGVYCVSINKQPYIIRVNNNEFYLGARYDAESGFDFSEYPFSIDEGALILPEAPSSDIAVTLHKAVTAPVGFLNTAIQETVKAYIPLQIVSGVTTLEETQAAYTNKRPMYFMGPDNIYHWVTKYTSSKIDFIPENENITITLPALESGNPIVISGGDK